MKRKVEIEYEIAAFETLSEAVKRLINASEQALLASHSPYSRFRVGAALLLEDGSIVQGSNQENAAYPIGFCAERTALAARIATRPDQKITAIAISVMNRSGAILPPIAPCGMCRQALLEEEDKQERKIAVYLSGNDGNVLMLSSIADLLPFRFSNSILEA